jgi:hypothetical protein
MFHPLAQDITGLTDDELYKKYNELNSKYISAHRIGSGSVIQQMSMLLEHYRNEMRNRQEKLLNEAGKRNSNFKNIIDIK